VMPSGKHSIHLQAFHGDYWQRLPEIACQQYHQAAKDVVISPKILQCEVKCLVISYVPLCTHPKQ
ncbi:hypothetical protein EVAR_87218_1, partial [Eumeta japonica]